MFDVKFGKDQYGGKEPFRQDKVKPFLNFTIDETLRAERAKMKEIILQLELANANLKNLLLGCMDSNGLPYCKNCGLDEEVLNQVKKALALCRRKKSTKYFEKL